MKPKKLLLSAVAAMSLATASMAQTLPSYVPTNGLVGYWGFDGNANDASGNNLHGTVNGATLTTDRNGQQNKAYYFNGSAGIYNTNTTLRQVIDGNKPFSIGFWFNRDNSGNYPSFSLQSKVLFSFDGDNTPPYKRLRVEINQPTDATTEISFAKVNNITSCNGALLYRTNSFIQPGTWHYLFVTYDGANVQMYLDNTLLTQVVQGNANMPCSMGGPDNYTKGFTMGNHYQNNLVPFTGKLDDLAMFSRVLTQSEITALYTSGATVPSYVPTNGLVGWWPFNGNANDESGNGNDGTVNTATLTTDRNGEINKAYSFDGVKDFIQVQDNNSLDFTNQYSISMWVNLIDYTLNNQSEPMRTMIAKPQNSYGSGYSFRAIEGAAWNGNSLAYTSAWTTPATNATIGSLDTIRLNKWTNVVYTYDGINAKLFKNGMLTKSGTFSYTLTNSTQPLYIGKEFNATNPSNNRWFKGKLDDIAMYNRALTQQEVTALYNSGQSTISSSTITVDAPTSAKQNDTVQVAINTTALNAADGVISYQANLAYDATRLTYLSHNLTGTLHNGGTEAVNATTTGTLNLSYMTTTALAGTGSLIKFKFLAKNVLGKAPFKLSDFFYNTTAINQLTQDTVTIIDGVPPTGKIKYSANTVRKADSLLITVTFNEKMASSPLPQLSLSGANTKTNRNLTMVNDTVFTLWHVVEKGNGAVNVLLATGKDLAGNTLVANPTSGSTFSVLPIVYGDIDTNRVVQAYDAALALQYSVKLNPLPNVDPLPWSNWRVAVANVDTVGDVTANDAALILRYSAKIINTFPGNSAVRRTSKPTNTQVMVTQEGSDLVFRATGSLIGLNVFVSGDYTSLGTPVILDNNMLVATNIDQTNYAIGLASAYETPENQPFMKIPLKSNSIGTYTIELVVNDAPTPQTVGTVTAIKTNAAVSFGIYPNPTKDVLSITKANGHTVKIFDLNGKEVFTQDITTNQFDISMKQVGAKGIYFVQLTDAKQHVLQSQKIILE